MASYKRVKAPSDPQKLLDLIKDGVVTGTSIEFFADDDGEIYAVVWLDKSTRWDRHQRVP